MRPARTGIRRVRRPRIEPGDAGIPAQSDVVDRQTVVSWKCMASRSIGRRGSATSRSRCTSSGEARPIVSAIETSAQPISSSRSATVTAAIRVDRATIWAVEGD